MTAIVTICLFLRMPMFYIPAVVLLKKNMKKPKQPTAKQITKQNQKKRKHNPTPFKKCKTK